MFHSPKRFNPRALCGARQWLVPDSAAVHCFNPRTPCGARPTSLPFSQIVKAFQSTHSLRSATCIYCITRFVKLVSIHALRRVRHTSFVPSFSLYGFNPRTPKSATCPNYYFESSRSRFNPRTPKSATAKGRFYRHFCLHLWGHSPTDAVYSYSCRDSLKFSLLSSWFLIGKKDVHYALALRTVSRHAFRHSFI